MQHRTFTLQAEYRAALISSLKSGESVFSTAWLLGQKGRQYGLRSADWLDMHQQTLTDLTDYPLLAQAGSTEFQATHDFLKACLRSWDAAAESVNEPTDPTEADFQALVLDHLQDAVIVTNLKGIILYWNEFAGTLYQLTDDSCRQSILAVLAQPDQGLAFEILAHLETQAYWEGALTVQRRDGSLFIAQSLVKVIKDSGQRPCGYVGVSRDVTEQKHTEQKLYQINARLNQNLQQKAQALSEVNEQLRKEIRNRQYIEEIFRQNEERFYKISANIPGMLFQCVRQPDGREILPYVSARCRNILEMEPGEIYHFLPVLNQVPETDRACLRAAMDISATQLSPLIWEGAFITRSGRHKWLRLTSQPSRDTDGEVIWDGVLFDVTERRQAEIERERQAQEYQNLVANIPGGIYRCIAAANWPIDFISEAISMITGYPLDHFMSGGLRTLDDITHPDDQLMLQTAIDSGIKHHVPHQVEYRIITVTGDVRWVLERGQGIWNAEGNLEYLGGVILDINDLKMAEAKIRSSLAEKEVLLREVHHRVKNNLNVVHSMLEMQARQTTHPESQKILADSQQRLQVMSLIHEQLYRSEQLSAINFAEYLDGLVRNFSSMAVAKDNQVQLQLDVEPIFVSLETAIPMGLIVNELLTNAFKHAFPHKQGGMVHITFTQNTPKQLYLAVCDTGIGLPTTFSTVSHASLGMRLVTILADQLDAHLQVISPPGTQFHLTFAPGC